MVQVMKTEELNHKGWRGGRGGGNRKCRQVGRLGPLQVRHAFICSFRGGNGVGD